jgi:small subunit ribosomal protein S10
MVYFSLKSYNISLLNKFCKKIKQQRVFLDITGPISLPKKKKIYTVIRSSHVYSLSREQFEVCTYRRLFVLKNNFDFIKNSENLYNFLKFYKDFLQKVPVGISLKLSFKD